MVSLEKPILHHFLSHDLAIKISCKRFRNTVKRPKFDTLFGGNIFFLLIFFSCPPLKIFGGVS
jgi:hypothetical protein